MTPQQNSFRDQSLYGVLIEEYKTIRTEILERARMQIQILAFSMILIAAAVSFTPIILESERFFLLLLVAPISLALGWLYYEQDTFIVHAARYANEELRPRIARAIATQGVADTARESRYAAEDFHGVLGWEDFRSHLLFATPSGRIFLYILTIFRLVLTAGGGVVSLGTFVYLSCSTKGSCQPWNWRWEEVVLLILGGLMAVVVISRGILLVKEYKEIQREGSSEQ